MPFCGNCGHPLKETDLICPVCGEEQPNAATPAPDAVPAPEETIPSIPDEIPPQQSSYPSNIPHNDTADHNTYDTNSSYQSYQTNYNPVPPTYQGSSYSTPNTPLTNNSNGFGIAALVLGICSIAICCCYGFGLIPAIIGLILGIVQNKKNSNGIAVSGIVLSIIGILLNAVWLIYMVLIISASDSGVWDQFFEEFSKEFSDEFSENYDYYYNSTL